MQVYLRKFRLWENRSGRHPGPPNKGAAGKGIWQRAILNRSGPAMNLSVEFEILFRKVSVEPIFTKDPSRFEYGQTALKPRELPAYDLSRQNSGYLTWTY